MGKYILAWVPMVVIAIANAFIRETWFAPNMEELLAHQVSPLTAVVLFGIYIWFVIRKWRPLSGRHALLIGLTWLGLTVAFEFLFGHYAMGAPWGRLVADYDLSEGRVWALLLLWVTLAPYCFHRLQRS